MPVQNLKYCEYFDVDEKYFPCIDESAINSGAAWDTTYPHKTFIDLLNLTEKMLGGNTNRSIWIHGAYGTGKSHLMSVISAIANDADNLQYLQNKKIAKEFAVYYDLFLKYTPKYLNHHNIKYFSKNHVL